LDIETEVDKKTRQPMRRTDVYISLYHRKMKIF